MIKKDVKIVLSSEDGREVYLEATISRTIARQIESLLEHNDVVMLVPDTTDNLSELCRRRDALISYIYNYPNTVKTRGWVNELEALKVKIADLEDLEKATDKEADCI